MPIALLWFGLSETAIIFVTITGSLLAVTQATKAGFDNVPRILSMAGRNLGAKGPQLFWHVLLPASLPYLVDGLRQGWAFAWRSLITGEMIYISLGLGQLLMTGRDLNDINLVVAVMVLIARLDTSWTASCSEDSTRRFVTDGEWPPRLPIELRNAWVGFRAAAGSVFQTCKESREIGKRSRTRQSKLTRHVPAMHKSSERKILPGKISRPLTQTRKNSRNTAAGANQWQAAFCRRSSTWTIFSPVIPISRPAGRKISVS